MPGAPAVEERVADGVAHDPDRVVGAADLGQRRPLLDQRRRDPQLQPRVRQLGQRQQLDRVAQLAGVLDVGELEPVDPRAGDLGRPHVGAEGELRQDRQLVRGVGAVDVEGRVGLGVAQLLRLAQRRRRRPARRGSSSVRMKLQVPLTIAARLWIWLAARATPSAWTIGMPPPTLASKATARPNCRAWAKTSGPCSASSALLAVTTSLPAARASRIRSQGRVGPPHRLDDDVHLGVVDDPTRVGHDPGLGQRRHSAASRGRGRPPT